MSTDEPITPELFSHLVMLAALELNEAEREYLRQELNHQLKAIRELEAIPLDEDIPISSHGVPYTPEMIQLPRPDEWQPSEKAAKILEQAPQTAGNYVIVPDIPHVTLE